MKKLAIIGSSNSFIKDGYGQMLKEKLGDECQIFGLVDTGLGYSVLQIITKDILDKYEFILLECGPFDSRASGAGYQSKYLSITYLLYILSRIQKSYSKPILLISGYIHCGFDDEGYVYQAIADIFNIPHINLSNELRFIKSSDINYDLFHYNIRIARFILERVLYTFSHAIYPNIKIDINIEFDVFIPKKGIGIIDSTRGTSLIKESIFICDQNAVLFMPSASYICGYYAWIEKNPLYINYRNDIISFSQTLGYMNFRNLFVYYDIGSTIDSGLKGGQISFSPKPCHAVQGCRKLGDIVEGEYPATLVSFLLANQAPIPLGRSFYMKHMNIFADWKYRTDMWLNDRYESFHSPFWQKMKAYIDNTVLMYNLLTLMPELGNRFTESEFAVEQLIVWAWLRGCDEIESLASHRMEIVEAITVMANTPYKPYLSKDYSVLHHVIWLFNPDLHKYDPETTEGRFNICAWMAGGDSSDYGLDKIHDYPGLAVNSRTLS